MEDTPATKKSATHSVCVSCGCKFKGAYCRNCGEKKIVPERDFSLLKFWKQTLWHFINFDSKLLLSFWLLFTKPGYLTADWIAGRRVMHMKPFQLFFVASVLFYFFLPTTTAHFTSTKDLIKGYEGQNMLMNTFHFDAAKALTEKAEILHLDEATLTNTLTETTAQKSKTWLFLIIPCWGLLIYLFFHQKIPWLVPHLVYAMHGLTFYILSDLALHAVLALVGLSNIGKNIFIMLLFIFSVYQVLATRRVYGSSWPITFFKSIGMAAGFILLILMYRQLMTIWAIAGL